MTRSRSVSRGRLGTLLVVAAVAVAGGVFGVVPVRSQALRLVAGPIDAAVPLDDPWAAVWDGAAAQEVPLSAQNVAPPFGGGAVSALTARALYDAERIYVLVEWDDGTVDDTVNSVTAFSDAVALQFPSAEAAEVPPFTMGGPDLPVNIWHWKAVWQADIDGGFTSGSDRYPDTAVDDYPSPADPLYQPARSLGNALAQTEHASPVENLIAAGFGTLTTAAVQDVVGAGSWRDGRWRALFARDLVSMGEGHAEFAPGRDAMVAFAVWDGDEGDRNGQKSIAQFIELSLAAEAAPAPDALGAPPAGGAVPGPPSSPWPWTAAVIVAFAAIVILADRAARGRGRA